MTACSFLFLSLLLIFLDAHIATDAQAQSVNTDAAKREGKVVLYGTVVPQATESTFKSFENKYGIKVEYWRGSANAGAGRAVNEWRAGRPGYDVVE